MRSWFVPAILIAVHAGAAGAAELTLEQAYRSAHDRNEVVKQSDAQVAQAEARVSRVRGGLLPELTFTASHLIQPEPDDPIAREFSPGQQTFATFTAVQPLWR